MDKAAGGPRVERKVFEFKGPGVAMGMHNRDDQIRLCPVLLQLCVSARLDALPLDKRGVGKVCIDAVEGGAMTRDLAVLIRADHPWLTTNQFLDMLDSNLKRAMV